VGSKPWLKGRILDKHSKCVKVCIVILSAWFKSLNESEKNDMINKLKG
jgi:hypothetical protein